MQARTGDDVGVLVRVLQALAQVVERGQLRIRIIFSSASVQRLHWSAGGRPISVTGVGRYLILASLAKDNPSALIYMLTHVSV